MLRLAAAATLAFTCEARGLNSRNVCEAEMLRAARENAVPVGILYAVAMTETGQRGALNAYAMNIDGRAVFNRSLREALDQFAQARASGARFIDIGCMQIDHHYHGARFRGVDHMFDPRSNVSYAARLLHDLRVAQGSWTAAVARYHAGPGNPPAQRGYVCAVIARMIASDFGSWTPESKAFCAR